MMTNDEARNRRLALLLSAPGYSITLFYLLYGGTSNGKHWFRNLIPNDSNGGVLLLIVFTVPLFIANIVATLLLKDGAAASDNRMKENNVHTSRHTNQKSCYTQIQSSTRRVLGSPRWFTVAFVIFPCIVFFLCQAQRHYLSAMGTYPTIDNINKTSAFEEDDEYNYQITAWRWELLHHISNSAAVVGLIAFSHLLIPVSKHSPLIVLLNWTPQEALVMHQYAGRLAIFGVIIHGIGHLMHAHWRWWSVYVSGYDTTIADSHAPQNMNWMEKSFWRGFIPPPECWQHRTEPDFGPGCINEDVSCSCLDFWINFTGLLGLIAVLVLMVGSLNHIRRRFYSIFYIVHIIAAPVFILASVLHYNRAIMYMLPSLLYYASQAVPVHVESLLSHWQSKKGSRIISISKIPCHSRQRTSSSNVLSIEFEATEDDMNNFQPGSYCTLQIPSLSTVAHPFTVNIVPEHSNRLRILMRQIGPFTTQIVDLIGSTPKSQLNEEEKKECMESQCTLLSLPKMYIDMFNTSPRMTQLHHHTSALFIAGGIGITPYLSMLMEITTSRRATTSLKSVTLHWICRDAALIRYVHEHYFATILEKCNESDQIGDVSIRIVPYFTGSDDDAQDYGDGLGTVTYLVDTHRGDPVKLSAYSIRNTNTLATFASIFGFGAAATMYCYTYLQSAQTVSTRIVGLLAICVVSIVLSTMFNWFQNEKAKYIPLSTGESYGSAASYSPKIITDYMKNTPGYEYVAEGRPSAAKLFSSLHECEENENLGVFLCGPSLMVKQLRAFLSMMKRRDVDVYEEIFEL